MQDLTEHVRGLTRPHSSLLKYYILSSLPLLPLLPVFVIVLLYRFFRYRTMGYRFDDDGVTMSWGVLFRREISLNYSRIQDIHLVSNLVERWLGLARLQIQTAAGSATAEMTIEGLREFEQVRDFLYSRMRGTRKSGAEARVGGSSVASDTETVAAILEAAAELRGLREELASRREPASPVGELR